MMIMAAKVPKKKLLIAVLLFILAAAVLAVCLGRSGGAGQPQQPAARQKVATNDERIAFLASYGWEVKEKPVQTQQVLVPTQPGEVFQRYNELQQSQGYDLMQYAGQTLSRYVYEITNYPAREGTYYATLLILEDRVVGADVASGAKDGVMHALSRPG